MKLKTAGSHQNKRKHTRWESGHGGVGPGGIAETASNAGLVLTSIPKQSLGGVKVE